MFTLFLSAIKRKMIYCQEVQGINIVRNYQFDNKIYNEEPYFYCY